MDPAQSSEDNEESLYEIDKVSKKFQSLLNAVNERVRVLAEQTELSVTVTRGKVDKEIEAVDREIARLQEVLKTCDELEDEFTKIRHIGEIAEDFKRRLKVIEADLKS